MFKHKPPRYCAYLLRCWQEQNLIQLGLAAWRFSLEDPHTGDRYGFATFEALMAFLHEKLIDERPGATELTTSIVGQCRQLSHQEECVLLSARNVGRTGLCALEDGQLLPQEPDLNIRVDGDPTTQPDEVEQHRPGMCQKKIIASGVVETMPSGEGGSENGPCEGH